ncbi:MAG: hypothetical protein A3J46_03515 [Candidatus Yanofskybacteria bacterium RIFCSPHIGHO2_02_FULL_41_11]|uniref:Large ribosomal subunit protein uL15 n=1 Tax=Candidatus Yanofskybacteria bacterium RIFCSPHIGHO2_02_FULL_41_11 TaxID=1802675 RepID=A0A1F8F7M2_9BACT|nr:MAG: hypothetical protein A3J46_03515 [Candidatus Yanofskybacteria bacterium RIFCSPHIGHO2_02_FULL_41_11]
MNLSELKSHTPRKSQKRVGRGGKRGTFSGKGSKGQKSRAGAGVKPGFRGGDNRIWQLFPKKRGASKKPGSSRPHHRHRFFQVRHSKPEVLNLSVFNKFKEGQLINPEILIQEGLVSGKDIKILSDGELNKKLDFEGFKLSVSAKQKILKAGGNIK